VAGSFPCGQTLRQSAQQIVLPAEGEEGDDVGQLRIIQSEGVTQWAQQILLDDFAHTPMKFKLHKNVKLFKYYLLIFIYEKTHCISSHGSCACGHLCAPHVST